MANIISIIFNYIFLLFFMQSALCELCFRERNEFHRATISKLKKFISYYKDYNFVVHYDRKIDIDITTIIKILPTFQLVSGENNFFNPANKNTVNIFFIHNSSDFTSFPYNLKIFNEDGCNLFITFKCLDVICSLDIVDLAPASFIFNINTNQLFSCFTDTEDLRITPVVEDQLDVLQIFHRTYSDLRGETIKLYFIRTPEILCINDDRTGKLPLEHNGPCNPVGPEAYLVKVLGKKLNFTPEFWPFDNKIHTLTWKEMLNAISRGDAEFGVGSVFLSEDGPVYYTSFISNSAIYGTYFVNPTKQFNLGMILESFDLSVYVISLTTLILILIAMIVFAYLFNYNLWDKQCTFALVKMVTEQGSNLNNRFYSFNTVRFILFLWLFFNIIFCTVFKSRISAVLTKPQVHDFRSVKDLSENDFVFTIGDRFKEMFYEKHAPKNIKLRRLTQDYVKDICSQAETFFKGRYALVHGEHNIMATIKLCKFYYPLAKLKDQRFLMQSKNYHALALTPSSPHKKQFTHIIDYLMASGIIYNWYEEMTFQSSGVYTKEHFSPNPLKIKQIYSLFVLLTVGLGIASIVFILEKIEAALTRSGNITTTVLAKL